MRHLHALLLAPAHATLRYRAAWTMYLLILLLGSVPGARAEVGQVASGILLHSAAYASIAFLLFTGGSGGVRRALATVGTVALMGAADEFVQSFFPYRHADLRDWAVDCTAAGLTTLVLAFALRRR